MRNSLPYLSGTSCLRSNLLLQVAGWVSWRLEAALQCSLLRVPLLYGFLRIQAPVWERPILGLADHDRFFFQSFEASPLYWLLTVYIATNLGGFLSSSGGFFQQHLLFSELGRWSLCRMGCDFPLAFWLTFPVSLRDAYHLTRGGRSNCFSFSF